MSGTDKCIQIESRLVAGRGSGVENGEYLLVSTEFLFGVMKMF